MTELIKQNWSEITWMIKLVINALVVCPAESALFCCSLSNQMGFFSPLVFFSLSQPVMLVKAQRVVGIYPTVPSFTIWMKPFNGWCGLEQKQSIVNGTPTGSWASSSQPCVSPGSHWWHRCPCPCREAMAAWHVGIDVSGLRLCAAATKAHSGRDNGELGGWVVFYHSALSLSLSLSLSRVHCVDCLTLAICCQLGRTRSQIGPRYLGVYPETFNLSVITALIWSHDQRVTFRSHLDLLTARATFCLQDKEGKPWSICCSVCSRGCPHISIILQWWSWRRGSCDQCGPGDGISCHCR